MSVWGTLVTGLLVTLARPSTWLLALAGFLVRGGIVILCLPIVILPTPVGIANLVGPTLVGFVFGGISVGFVALALAGVGLVLGWIVFGGTLGAAAEAELVRIVVDDEEITHDATAVPPLRHGSTTGVLAIRLLALAPLLFALAWGAAVVGAVTYRELTLPSDVVRPIFWRVFTAVPEAVVLIVAAWAVGEIVAARAIRHLIVDDVTVGRALRDGIVDLVRRPVGSAVLFVVPGLALILVLVPVAAASGVAWTVLRSALEPLAETWQVIAALLGFVGLWLGGLALAALVCAWRSAAWTVDLARRRGGPYGTASGARPGDWKRDAPSVTL